ncbi:WXG100 family type VII secretion target [Nocardia sp. R7R-8]|uniref:WXG100 family type VII secretion target n=1 Tax=Nocardia sp. R7R-8 TaxID=3459304 RepID=UPI00403DB595
MTDGGDSASGASISVVPEKVREVGQYTYELAESLQSALRSVAQDVAALLDGGWSGGAATDFSAGWPEVRGGGVQIITALREMAEKLGVSAQTYESRDCTNASALNTSASSLELP